MTTVQVTLDERDALYSQLLDHLSGIDGIYQAVTAEDFSTAERLGRDFADELRLIAELGWGDAPAGGESIDLKMPHEELHRVFIRIRSDAEGLQRAEEQEEAEAEDEAREFRNRGRKVREVSERILSVVGRVPPACQECRNALESA